MPSTPMPSIYESLGGDAAIHVAVDVVSHLMATLTSLGVDADTCNQIGYRLAPLRAEVVGAR